MSTHLPILSRVQSSDLKDDRGAASSANMPHTARSPSIASTATTAQAQSARLHFASKVLRKQSPRHKKMEETSWRFFDTTFEKLAPISQPATSSIALSQDDELQPKGTPKVADLALQDILNRRLADGKDGGFLEKDARSPQITQGLRTSAESQLSKRKPLAKLAPVPEISHHAVTKSSTPGATRPDFYDHVKSSNVIPSSSPRPSPLQSMRPIPQSVGTTVPMASSATFLPNRSTSLSKIPAPPTLKAIRGYTKERHSPTVDTKLRPLDTNPDVVPAPTETLLFRMNGMDRQSLSGMGSSRFSFDSMLDSSRADASKLIDEALSENAQPSNADWADAVAATPYTGLQKMVGNTIQQFLAAAPLVEGEELPEEDDLEVRIGLRRLHRALHGVREVGLASDVPATILKKVTVAADKHRTTVNVEVDDGNSVPVSGTVRDLDYRPLPTSTGLLLSKTLPRDKTARIALLREKQKEAERHFGISGTTSPVKEPPVDI